MTAARPAPRRRVLQAAGPDQAALTWYPPGFAMAAHAHDADQLSLVLAGAVSEETGSRSAHITAGCAGFKAAGLAHCDVYGRNGALILSFNLPHGASREPWRWRRAKTPSLVRTAALALQDGPDWRDALIDCAALLDGEDPSGRPEPAPAWLERTREAIDADPAGARAGTLAADAGVHRVHLCRRFAAAYGVPLSLYRRQAMVARAVRALAEEGAAGGAAAQEAGFADQAHFIRALKAETGATPSRLGALLRAA